MEFMFTEEELKHLDDIIPEETKRKREDHKKHREQEDARAANGANAYAAAQIAQLQPPSQAAAHVRFQAARNTQSAQVCRRNQTFRLS